MGEKVERTAEDALAGIELGLGANWIQFAVYTLITLLIGVTIGTERVALPPSRATHSGSPRSFTRSPSLLPLAW